MKKQNIIVVFLITVLLAFTLVVLNMDKQNRLHKYIQQQHQEFEIQFNTIYHDKDKISQMIYNDIINDNRIINILKQYDKTNSIKQQAILRNKLIDLLDERYAQWELLGLQQLHFHTKNNISILRMHKKDKFGDNLTKVRESIRLANYLKVPVQGFEVGKVKSGFRFVFPIIDEDGEHLGSVEASMSTEQFEKELTQAFHKKVKFLISKDIIDNKSTTNTIDRFYKVSKISKNFYIHKLHAHKHMHIPTNVINRIDKKLGDEEVFSIYFQDEGKYKILTFLPVKNIKDKKVVAYFMIYGNANYLDNLFKDFNILFIILFILYIVVLIYIYNNNKYKHTLNLNLQLIHSQKEELAQSIVELEKQNIQIANQMEENRKKDTMIAEQSRLASLGEMIGNIAHQWRQPLSAISTSASSMSLQNELGLLDCQNDLTPALNKIIEKTQFLSQTIEDFRHFIEGKKESVDFILSSAVDNALNVVDSSIQNHHITIVKDYDSIVELTSYKNEFIQGVLNIINNAKDALDESGYGPKERFIFINIKQEESKAVLVIQDNAGGIPNDIKQRIFEPYFTTKHQSQGTGLGLYMTYKIITESMQGSITIENANITYNNKEYYGAKFVITLPLILEDKD